MATSNGAKRTLDSAEQEILALYDGMKRSKKFKKDESSDEGNDPEVDPAAVFGDTDSENDDPVFLEGKAGEEEEESEDEDPSPQKAQDTNEVLFFISNCAPMWASRTDFRNCSSQAKIDLNSIFFQNAREEEEEYDDDGRRAINYQIAKNKGLTPKRKKEYRNPRVRHRIKYRKANIRRKGQVRAMRNESGHYGGETSGINKQVVKSVKLK